MLLYLLVKIAGAKRVLELGTATGYSGIWLLRGTDGGSLTTFEVDHKRAESARANFSAAGLGKQALVLEQDAIGGLEKLDSKFDACFIDLLNVFPSKEKTQQAFELCMGHLEPGAVLMADNALRQGEVLDGEGGFCVFGKQVAAERSLADGFLPLGLAHGVRLKRDIAEGEPLTWSDVAYDAGDSAVRVRREMEAAFGRPDTGSAATRHQSIAAIAS